MSLHWLQALFASSLHIDLKVACAVILHTKYQYAESTYLNNECIHDEKERANWCYQSNTPFLHTHWNFIKENLLGSISWHFSIHSDYLTHQITSFDIEFAASIRFVGSFDWKTSVRQHTMETMNYKWHWDKVLQTLRKYFVDRLQFPGWKMQTQQWKVFFGEKRNPCVTRWKVIRVKHLKSHIGFINNFMDRKSNTLWNGILWKCTHTQRHEHRHTHRHAVIALFTRLVGKWRNSICIEWN